MSKAMISDTKSLQVENVKKLYGKKVAVKTMSFTMHQGEIVGLLGPNGAGKTTCFYIIAGFIRATAGRILLDNTDITNEPMYKRSRLGISYLPQEPSVFRKLTVEDNIWAILETRDDLSKVEKKEKMEHLIEDLGVQKVRRQKAFTLSGGERRRTEIARSLATDPRFLLLDEPFAGIDPIAVYEIKKIIEHLSERGIGILITDHNVRDTFTITHRSYITNLGEIIVSGSKEELLESELARTIYLGKDFSM
ncbi:LPS export ABC transporter ATP-binding protein [Oceanispirochaeta sp.]|jgi:lipopolysaccharide export system ATP-binding protein|uniref:LPS export ABC transporter ATP-binding protein n=1 Tax=Oceanispirochaeta sp. TaxID=2035350 RepID=UPI00262B25B2|nr:LPS export ABC transporter ATP-binding protein [Oceanispirochaeta sp.]MDA3957185.1 LPS export ABC transporter ATP-binding protein [Oceanispirochaeta sp.]